MARFGQQSPRAMLTQGVVWAVLCGFFLGLSAFRLAGTVHAAQQVGVWRYAGIGFWLLLLLFWVRQIGISLRRMRGESRVV